MQPNLTMTGIADREVAQAILQRVKPTGAPVILDLGDPCQPLYVHPWLGNVENARAFFSGGSY